MKKNIFNYILIFSFLFFIIIFIDKNCSFIANAQTTTLDLNLETNADDGGWAVGNSTLVDSNPWLILGYYDGTYTYGGAWLRYTNVALPRGATITAAHVTLTGRDNQSTNVVNVKIRAVDEDNPTNPTNYADMTGRTRTGAQVNWSNLPAVSAGVTYDTSDLSTVVQEIVNREGWLSGNALMLFLEDNGSTVTNYTYRDFHMRDSAPASSAKLHIEYTVGNPESTTYKIIEYSIGSTIASTSGSGYSLFGALGEPNYGMLTSTDYKTLAGLSYLLQVNTPPVPTFTNPATNYDRLKFVIDEGGNASDTSYAIAISTDNFVADTRYVKSDKTIGNTLTASDFQSYAYWGGASGAFVTGLQNDTTYYIKVKAAQGVFTETDFGPVASATTSNPSLTFDLDTSSITFNNLNQGNSYTDATKQTTLTTSTNAHNGYVVYAKETQSLSNAGATSTIDDYSGTNEVPTTWSGTGFGYNTSDTDLTGPGDLNRFSGSKYAGFTTNTQDPVAGHRSLVVDPVISGEAFTISYKVVAPSTTAAGNYTNTIIYTIVPTY